MRATQHTAMGTSSEYVLGTGSDELARLALQHDLWRGPACTIWERAGFGPGQRLLDLGCGPGFTTLDLARIVGPTGNVVAVDVSPRFIDHLRSRPRDPASGRIEPQVGDAASLSLPEASLDGAYARWVLLFVADPEGAVAAVARALKPGAAFAVQDYAAYSALRLFPPSEGMARVIAAVERSWRESGGDPDPIARVVPAMEKSGLRVESLDPVVRIARPGEALWQWPDSFFRNFLPVLVQKGLLREEDRRSFMDEWDARSRDKASYFMTPLVMSAVARKPR